MLKNEKSVEKAHNEFEEFRIEQDKKYLSDLDKIIQGIAKK